MTADHKLDDRPLEEPPRLVRTLLAASSTCALATALIFTSGAAHDVAAQQIRAPQQQRQAPVVRTPVVRTPVVRAPVVRTPVVRSQTRVPNVTRQAVPRVTRTPPPIVRNAPPIVRNRTPVVRSTPPIVRNVPPVVRNRPPVVVGRDPVRRVPPVVNVPGSQGRPGRVPPVVNVPGRPGVPPVVNVPGRPGVPPVVNVPGRPGVPPVVNVPGRPGTGPIAGGTRPTIPTLPGGNKPPVPVVIPNAQQRPGGPLAGTINPGNTGVVGPRPFPGQRVPIPGTSIPGGRTGTVFVPAGTALPKLPRATDVIAQRFLGNGGVVRAIRPSIPPPPLRTTAYRAFPKILGHRWSDRPRLPLYFASALVITGAVVATTYRPWHRPAPTCYVGGGVFYRYPGSDTCFDFASAAPGDYFETGGKVYRWNPTTYETAEHCIEEQTTRNEVVAYEEWKVKTPAPEVERVRVVAAKAAEKPPITLASPIPRDRYDCSSCLTAMGPVRGEDGQCTATIVNNCTHTVVTIGGFTKGENQAFCDFASELEPGQEVAACAQPCENFDESRAYMNVALPPEGYSGDVSQCRVIQTADAGTQTPAPAATEPAKQ